MKSNKLCLIKGPDIRQAKELDVSKGFIKMDGCHTLSIYNCFSRNMVKNEKWREYVERK